MSRYHELHRVDHRPRDLLARRIRARRLADAVRVGARLFEAAVRQMVRRRTDQSVPQRGRPASRRARRPAGAHLHLDRDRRRQTLHLSRARRRSEPLRGDAQGAGRRARRSGADLHADDRRSGVRHARLRAHRRDPLGRLRRLRRGEPRHTDRRCDAEADGHLRRRDARRQAGPLQAPGRRGDAARGEPAAQGDHRQPGPRSCDGDRPGPRSRLRDAALEHDGRARCRANGSNPPSRRTSSTRPARPASRRACSATPAATPSRSPRRCAGSSASSRAKRCSRRATSAGWSVTPTSSMRRSSNGSTTIMYEGLPIRPDPAIWWKIVAEHKVRTMFSSPTAIRVLKKQDPAYMKQHDLSALKYLFLAGEPLDEPTARWAADSLGCGDRRQLLADGDRAGRSSPRNRASRTRRASSAVRRSRCTATTSGCCAKAPATKRAPTKRRC